MRRLRYIIGISALLVSMILGVVWYQCGARECVVLDVEMRESKINVAMLKRSLLQDDGWRLQLRYVDYQDMRLGMLGCVECVKDDGIALVVGDVKREPLFKLEGYVLGDGALLDDVILFITDVAAGISLCVQVGDWLNVRYAVGRVEWVGSEGGVDVLKKLTVIIYDVVDDVLLKCDEGQYCADEE